MCYELFHGSALKLSRTPDSLPRVRFLRWPKIKTEINVVARVVVPFISLCRCRVESKRGSVERVNYGEIIPIILAKRAGVGAARAKSMVCSDRKRVRQSQITNATTGCTKHPQSINQGWNHWEWRNEIPINQEAAAKLFQRRFFVYRKDMDAPRAVLIQGVRAKNCANVRSACSPPHSHRDNPLI